MWNLLPTHSPKTCCKLCWSGAVIVTKCCFKVFVNLIHLWLVSTQCQVTLGVKRPIKHVPYHHESLLGKQCWRWPGKIGVVEISRSVCIRSSGGYDKFVMGYWITSGWHICEYRVVEWSGLSMCKQGSFWLNDRSAIYIFCVVATWSVHTPVFLWWGRIFLVGSQPVGRLECWFSVSTV